MTSSKLAVDGKASTSFPGGKGKDGSEKGRELKERNAFLSLLPLPPPPSKIPFPLAH